MGRLAAVLVVLVGASGAVGLAAAPAPTPAGCPLSDRTAVSSSRPGADGALVPSGANRLLVCDYSGFTEPAPLPDQSPPHRLMGDGSLADASRIAQLAQQLNALPDRSGPISCPADFGNQLVAYFRYPSGASDPVTVGLSGCQTITNGHVRRLGLGASAVTQMAKLARPAIIRGRVQVCGGPAPGGCHTGTFGSCGPARGSCSRTDRVAVLTATGRRIVTARLHRARFSVYVPAGPYRVELLADGKHVRGKVVKTAVATANAGHTTNVVFRILVP